MVGCEFGLHALMLSKNTLPLELSSNASVLADCTVLAGGGARGNTIYVSASKIPRTNSTAFRASLIASSHVLSSTLHRRSEVGVFLGLEACLDDVSRGGAFKHVQLNREQLVLPRLSSVCTGMSGLRLTCTSAAFRMQPDKMLDMYALVKQLRC